MVEFEPIDGVLYKHNYLDIFRKIRNESEDKRIEHYRYLCKTDLFFLLYFCLKKQHINADYKVARWVTDRIREVEEGPVTNTLDLWFRGGFKSTILTVGENIQDVLKDPSERIGIFAFNRNLSKAFLNEIKQYCMGFDDNMLQTWFPEIFWINPKKEGAPKWNLDDGLVLKRPNVAKEGTFEAWGMVDSMPTGRHFTKRMYDDVVTKDSVFTVGMMEKTIDAYRLSKNLKDHRRNRERIAGTRYDYGDAYGELIAQMEKGEIDLTARIRPMVEETQFGTEYHIYSEEECNAMRAEEGEYNFNAQRLLSPVSADHQVFRREFLTYWTSLKELEAQGLEDWNKYLLIDLAGFDERGKSIGRDRTAMITLATPPADARWFILETKIARLNPSDIMDYIVTCYKTWRHKKIGIEKERLGQMLDHFLKPRFQIEGISLGILNDLKHGGKSKDTRIVDVLEPKWSRREIIVNPEDTEYITEWLHFPGDKHRKDGLDATAYAPQLISFQGRRKRRRQQHNYAKTARGAY